MADFDPNTLCACGCGQAIGPWAPPAKHALRKPPRFISGHNCKLIHPESRTVPAPNPAGICMCGCGRPVLRAKTSNGANQVAGEFLRYLRGHWPSWETRRNPPRPDDPKGPNPSGICQCGCQQRVGVADRTDLVKQTVSGCYVRFLRGHDKWRNRPNGIDMRTGICACGCGQKTPIANRSARGNIKGLPMLYVDQAHAQRHNYTVDPTTGCWMMKGRRSDGYSRMRRDERVVLGHVWHYENRYGPIPEGFELDHLCRRRSCVSPEHMELVTHEENCRRKFCESEIPEWSDDAEYEIDPVTGCWFFGDWRFGQRWKNSYAMVYFRARLVPAHRIVYERYKGPIPSGLELDHLCRVKSCCCPDHLEPVTRTGKRPEGYA